MDFNEVFSKYSYDIVRDILLKFNSLRFFFFFSREIDDDYFIRRRLDVRTILGDNISNHHVGNSLFKTRKKPPEEYRREEEA